MRTKRPTKRQGAIHLAIREQLDQSQEMQPPKGDKRHINSQQDKNPQQIISSTHYTEDNQQKKFNKQQSLKVDKQRMLTKRGTKRQQQISRAIQEQMGSWHKRQDFLQDVYTPINQTQDERLKEVVPAGILTEYKDVMGPIPRPTPLPGLKDAEEREEAAPDMLQRISFKVSTMEVIQRFIVWNRIVISYFGGNLLDQIRGDDTVQRRAERLRKALEEAGGTFVKIGQQMAMRIDLLPWAFCVELSKMLDKMPPIVLEEAIERIEASMKGSMEDTFQRFDPEPIGSASMACVYQAVLKDGRRVAVKVRRPGIGEIVTADMRVLDGLMGFLEFLTILRPGFTENLRAEFKETLFEELDFRKEARYQFIFRRLTNKLKQNFISAPRVYFDYCSQDVIVQEFVEGVWLSDVLAAVDHNDKAAMGNLRRMNIDPKRIARRLLWVNNWSTQESLIFHADPHPANIVIQPNSKLMFIDFGASGSVPKERRKAMAETVRASQNFDAEGMARASLAMVEPLPPIDINAFIKDVEAISWHTIYAWNDKNALWWERTTASQWVRFLDISSKYELKMNRDMLRTMRSTLLYDTLAARLDPDINLEREYRRFFKDQDKMIRKRVRRNLERQFDNDGAELYRQIEELTDLGSKVMERVRRLTSSPFLNFDFMHNKSVYSVKTIIELIWRTSFVTIVGVAGRYFYNTFFNYPEESIQEILQWVIREPLYLITISVLLLIALRSIHMRLGDRDVRSTNE